MGHIKKKHHYVPQYYLNGFTDSSPSSKIWVYEKGKQHVFLSSTVNIGHENHFYSFERLDGTRDSNSVENFLADRIEGPANPVITKIRNRHMITDKEKETLSVYLSAMLQRVPKHRDRVKGLLPGVINSVANEIKEGKKWKSRIEADRTAALRLLKRYELEAPKEVFLPSVSHRIVTAIYMMNWQFLTFDGKQGFITGDNPFAFDEGLGLGNLNAEITFPVSPNILLWATWQTGQGSEFIPVNEQTVEAANLRTATVASRYVFYRSKEQWIIDLLNRKAPVS